MKASELKRGMIIREGEDFFIVVGVDHRTAGRGAGLYQFDFKNLLTGRVINKRLNPTDAVEKADLESKKFQYLYKDQSGLHFMDMATYETLAIGEDIIGSAKDYLKENMTVEVLYYENKPVTLEMPPNVALKVIESAPGIKGDTSGKATKPATLETGLTINVPLFIEEGEMILVDTRTGQYLGRA